MTKGIDKQSADVTAMAVNWPMITALIAGTNAMRKATAFLPKWPAESQDSYDARLATATLLPAFSRTCTIMAAKPFARAIELDEKATPKIIQEYLKDINLYGTPFAPYLASLFLGCMQFGLMGVLVDCPPSDGWRSKEAEIKTGTRPYFTTYNGPSILGWRAEIIDGKATLTQLRLLETLSEPDGEFTDKEVTQVRVLMPGAWAIYRKNPKFSGTGVEQEWIIYQQGTTSIKRIPFVFFYGIHKSFGIGMPPLLDLAFLNVEHWQSSSDQQTILHVARIPILFAKGFQEQDHVIIGSSTAVKISDVKADLHYVEHSGNAIEAGRVSILDLEDRMRQTGAELLTKRSSASKTTATEVRFETEGNKSTLQKITEGFEESVEDCLELMGEWIGESFEAKVTLFKDFDASSNAPLNGDLLLSSVAEGIVSRETAFTELKRLDVLRPELQWDAELAAIKKNPPISSKPDVAPAKITVTQ